MADTKTPILLIDDDLELGQMLIDYLDRFDMACEHHVHPADGIEAASANKHKAIVLDVMMPEMDGMEACRRIRNFSSVPIIMLTARGEIADKVMGLEAGADDYLAKPFEPRELAARLQAMLRRTAGNLTSTEVENLVLNHRSGRAIVRKEDGTEKDMGLTDTEFAVLYELIKRRPEPVLRNDLFTLVRGFERDLTDRSIDIIISRLRHKLGDSANEPRFIRTVRYVGYAYIG